MNNIYKNYKLEDWVCDEQYVGYVLEGKNQEQFSKLFLEDTNLVDLAEEAKYMILELNSNKSFTVDVNTKDRIWENIEKSISPKKKNNVLKFISWAASSAAVLFLVWFSFNNLKKEVPSNVLVESTTQIKNLDLPDFSQISLDENSSISYDDKNYSNKRIIKLSGQAYFDVKKGQEFIVETSKGSIKVLGTTFSVSDKNKNLEVTCYTGKVKVSCSNKEVILTPGQQLDLDDPQFKKSISNSDTKPYFLLDVLSFKDKSINEIIVEIENIYNVKIDVDKSISLNKNFTGSIATNDLDKALKSLTWPLFLKYKIEGDKVLITKDAK